MPKELRKDYFTKKLVLVAAQLKGKRETIGEHATSSQLA